MAEREVYRYSASSSRLKTSEEELFELVEASGVPLDKEAFKVVLELLRLNVAPTAILQVLRSLAVSTGKELPACPPSPQPQGERQLKSSSSKRSKTTHSRHS